MQTNTLKKRRRRKLRPIFKILFALIIIFTLIFVLNKVFKATNTVFEKKLNLKSVSAPDYVDVELIPKGIARRGTFLKEINYIVVHYTGNPNSTAKNNRDYFAKPDTAVCSHFVIGLDGEIIQCVPLNEKSAASNNRNIDSISIEVCHIDETGKFNEATYNSLVKLVAWLCDNSSLTEKDVIRHYDVTGKQCPKYFVEHSEKWEEFKNDVKEELKKY